MRITPATPNFFKAPSGIGDTGGRIIALPRIWRFIAIAEYLYRNKLIRARWVLFLFSVFAVFAIAAMYEIFEWLYAVTQNPESGIASLGSQGDLWDAQKDMLADGPGSIVATVLFFRMEKPRP